MSCQKCNDLGVIRVNSLDRVETLMLCNCPEGKAQSYSLPRWEWKYGQVFDQSPCPVQWFKPDMIVVSTKGHMKLTETIQNKIDYWRAKISIAEAYWVNAKQEAEGA